MVTKKISKNINSNINKRKINTDKTILKKELIELDNLSRDELKELLLINSYKLALTKAQIEALIEILIKNKVTTYEEIWKKTNEIFKENKRE